MNARPRTTPLSAPAFAATAVTLSLAVSVSLAVSSCAVADSVTPVGSVGAQALRADQATPQVPTPSVRQVVEIPTTALRPTPIRISVEELPLPGATPSAKRFPQLVAKPTDPRLAVPEGFRVEIFAEGLDRPRTLANAPDGDVLVVLSRANQIVRLRDVRRGTSKDAAKVSSSGTRSAVTDDRGAHEQSVYLDASDGLDLPFGLAFHGDSLFIANTNSVLRYPVDRESGRPTGPPTKIASLPGHGYRQHWTRNLAVAPDGQHLFVTVGSESNVNEEPAPRASVIKMKLDGSESSVFASGLRNPIGLDFEPRSGRPFVTVNERDRLGDDLVPDYFTGLGKGDFFGWPYAYLSPENLDPRRMRDDGSSEAPELAERTRTPDVLFQAHSAPIALAFYRGTKFPERYRNGAFVALRGSWNRSRGTGYKVVFIPFGTDLKPLGHYEGFLTGFLLDPKGPTTWARPVGLLVRPDGSLLVSDDAAGRIFRIFYD